MNKKRILLITLIINFTLAVFIYGVSVGHYECFPFSLIEGLKRKFIPNNTTDYLLKGKYWAHWVKEISKFEDFTTLQNYNVMFGDSLIAESKWNDLFPEVKILNFGIGGETSEGLIRRIDQVIRTKPKKVFVMIGVNDLGTGIPVWKVIENYKKIAETFREKDIELIIQSTLHIGRDIVKERNLQINDLNCFLRDYCAKNRIQFVDLNKIFAFNGYLEERFTIDGIHLNNDAYFLWRNEIEKYQK